MTQKADGCRKMRTVGFFVYRGMRGWYNKNGVCKIALRNTSTNAEKHKTGEREPGNGKKGAISETNFRNNEKRCF